MKKYKSVLRYAIILFIIIYALGIAADICPAIRKYADSFFPSIGTDECAALLNTYGLVWTATTGIIVFVVQRGYHSILGLQMHDILDMALGKIKVRCLAVFFICKFLIYVIFYLCNMKYTLLMGEIEVFFSLIFIILSFSLLASSRRAAMLLVENTSDNIEKIKSGKKTDWKLKKSIQRANYNNSEECDVLIENLVRFLKKIAFPEIQAATANKEQILDYFKALEVYGKQIEIFDSFIEKICFSDISSIRTKHIFISCQSQLSSDASKTYNFRKFLLLRSLLSDIEYETDATDFLNILRVMNQEDELDILRCLLVYLKFKYVYTTSKGWALMYYEPFLNRYIQLGGSSKKTDWEQTALVFSSEWSHQNQDFRTQDRERLWRNMKLDNISLLDKILSEDIERRS